MTRLYSYILRYDAGSAPNPFWGTCTLTICKPAIRRTADIGDWVIGTGSKHCKLKDGGTYDLSDSLIYAMKITDIKELAEYDSFCKKSLREKIPKWSSRDWRKRVGDCIYDYSTSSNPTLRKSVHTKQNKMTDLSGHNALLSHCFYYFGEEAMPIPRELKGIIKGSQGHFKIENPKLVDGFLKWIKKFEKNKVFADPQLRYLFDTSATDDQIIKCSIENFKEDNLEKEKTVS